MSGAFYISQILGRIRGRQSLAVDANRTLACRLGFDFRRPHFIELRYDRSHMDRRTFVIATIVPLRALCASTVELRCTLCNATISSGEKYYQIKGGSEIYCERCYRDAPRCSVCKLPTHPDDIDPETGACSHCLAELPRCRACGKPIVGTAYQFRFAKGVFCSHCRDTRSACYVCGVPVGDDYWIYPDGRTVCGECGARAVVDVGEMQRIMQDVRNTVGKRLGLSTRKAFTLTIEKLSGIVPMGREEGAKEPQPGAALYGNELGLHRRLQDGQSEIVLLFGLPPELTYETAAHEYAHAWEAENGILNAGAELSEGFAQWVAADVLREKNFKIALERLEARTDFPYGTGYQRLRTMRTRTVLDLMLQKR